MNQKLMKMISRQTALVNKLSKGKLDDAEKKELDDLNKKIEGLSNLDSVEVGKTELATMTVKEFKDHVSKVQTETAESLDVQQMALLKRNIAAVKSQGKTKDEEIVAVEILVEQSGSDARLDGIEGKMDELFELVKGLAGKGASFDGRSTTGINDGDEGDGDGDGGDGGDGEGQNTGKADDMPASTAVAIEALGAIIERYQKIKTLIEAGETFTEEDLQKMWPGWELRDAVETATAVLAKLESLQALVESVHPALEKIAKSSDDNDDNDDNDDDNDGDGETPTEKGDKGKVSKWLSGEDMAVELDATAQFQAAKKSSLSSI